MNLKLTCRNCNKESIFIKEENRYFSDSPFKKTIRLSCNNCLTSEYINMFRIENEGDIK